MRGLTISDAAVARLAALAGGDAAVRGGKNVRGDVLDGDEIKRRWSSRPSSTGCCSTTSLATCRGALGAAAKLRNSDVQAAVYWLARALEAGAADPRRAVLVAVAAEDVGLADPMALQLAMAAVQAVQFLGLPARATPLTEAVVYLAAAPKSNAVYRAIAAAQDAVRNGEQHPVPAHLRNAVSELEDLGHGKGYVYAHDADAGVAAMPCLPGAPGGALLFAGGARLRGALAGGCAPTTSFGGAFDATAAIPAGQAQRA